METLLPASISPIINTFDMLVRAYIRIFPMDLLRYLLGAGGVYLLVNLGLKHALAGRKIRDKSPDREQMWREFRSSMRTVAIFAFTGAVFIFGGIQAGVLSIEESVATRGWLYFSLNVSALIVLHDAWFYWTHRLIHQPKLFRRFHREHHKSNNPSPWTAYSFDVGEAFINALYLPIALFLIPSSGLAIFVFLIHMMLRNAIGHCGYELFPSWRNGRPVFDWLTTVTHHDIHHAQAGWNYGLYFTWWDRLMETEHPLYHEKFANAVRKPLDGSAVAARQKPTTALLLIAGVSSFVLAIIQSEPVLAQTPSMQSSPLSSMTEGIWATQGHGAHVKFEPCDEEIENLCGRMIWAWDPSLQVSEDNLMLGDFRWDGVVWDDGWLVNPEDGKTYRGKITPLESGVLKLKGCAFIFCQSQVWRRVKDIPGCVSAQQAGLPAEVTTLLFKTKIL